jgi:ABC-type glutathione transport system ATPase component
MTDANGDDLLLRIRGLKIEGRTEEGWNEIVHGVDLDLKRGEVLGLIGESGAGKSTIGLAAMGFARDGCRLSAGPSSSTAASCARPRRAPGASCAATASPMWRRVRPPPSTRRTG